MRPPEPAERRTPSLDGRVIAITEARRAGDLASVLEKLGGVPYSVPAMREVRRRDLGPALGALADVDLRERSVAIQLAGDGAPALVDAIAEHLRHEPPRALAVRRAACRA